jgi:hypothetical protein
MGILRYIIDREYDAEMIFQLFGAGMYDKKQLAGFGMEKDLIDKIARAKEWLAVKGGVQDFVDQKYRSCMPYLRKTQRLYQKSWDEIDGAFFKRLTVLTGTTLKYHKYECVVSLFHEGVSNWNGNKIARSWAKNSYTQRRVTAHEVVIAHFFDVVRALNDSRSYSDKDIWQLAEVYAFTVNALDAKMHSFWPWEKKEIDLSHNYPELILLQKKYEKIISAGDIEEYLELGLKEQ